MNIIFPDSALRCIELQTNGDLALYTDMPEALYIDKHLKPLCPKNVLELGCGVGRASVFLFKKYGWNDTRFYLADGNTCEKRYKGKRTEPGEFYNTVAATNDFCVANGLTNIQFINLEQNLVSSISRKYDLVYSFLAIGFHWPIDFYLGELSFCCAPGALVIFGIRWDVEDDWIERQIAYIDPARFKIKECKFCPRESRKSILILEVL